MRTLLSCLALATLAGIIGCGEPAAPEKPADKPATTETESNDADDKSASATEAGDLQLVSLKVPAMH